MNRINWARLIAGGFAATVILFLTDGFFHERIVGTDWQAIYDHLHTAAPIHHGPGMLVYFVIFDLGRGMFSIFLYVLMRSCCGPGPKTAVIAGVVAWLAFTVTGPAQFIPLGFLSTTLWVKAGGFQLVTSIIGALVAGALYKDAAPGTA